MTTRSEKYSAGDIVWARIPQVNEPHLCIILENTSEEESNGHNRCMHVCNFTGSEVEMGEYAIDIGNYDLPKHWFNKQKPNTWIRCNEIDCIYSYEIISDVKGNIRKDYVALWLTICDSVRNCPISSKFEQACECEFEVIDRQVERGLSTQKECNCAT